MSLAMGMVLENRYRIDALLGEGGMGAVYRAWDLRLKQAVALKENTLITTASARQFEREALVLAGLRHPNLPRVSDHFVLPNGAQYLVMDYIEGEDLGTLLARYGPLDEARAVAWLEQVCDALSYLHMQTPPIIHRDIKPANIKITPAGKVFLVDFGVAKVGGAQTQTGAMAVTPGFSPPEQYGLGGTDARSDVYALGATLYALVTGQAPPESVQRTIQAAQLIPPRQLRPDLSPAVVAAIEAALCTTPTARPQSVAELRARLHPQPPHPQPLPQPPAVAGLQTAPRMPGWVWPLSAVALVAVALGLGFLLGGGPRSQPMVSAATPTDVPAPAPSSMPNPTVTVTPLPTTTPSSTSMSMFIPTATQITTPKPTATSTVTARLTKTPIATSTATPKPTSTATSTPIPTSILGPSPPPNVVKSPTPIPTQVCQPEIYGLIPADDSTHYSGQPILFRWNGWLCDLGGQDFVIMFDGYITTCSTRVAWEIECPVPTEVGEHSWQVAAYFYPNPSPILSEPMSMYIIAPP